MHHFSTLSRKRAQRLLAAFGVLLIWIGFYQSTQLSYDDTAYTHLISALCTTIIGLKVIWPLNANNRSPALIRWAAWVAIAVTFVETVSTLLWGGHFFSEQVNQLFADMPWSRAEMGLDTAFITCFTLIAQKFRKNRAMLLIVPWAVSSWVLMVTWLGKASGLPMFGGKMSDMTLLALAMMQVAILVMMSNKSPFKVAFLKTRTGRNVRWILLGGIASTSVAAIAAYQVGQMTGGYSARDMSMTLVALSGAAAANFVLVLWLGAYAQRSALRMERGRRQIAFQRDHDHLTGLLNRRAGTVILETKLASHDHKEPPFAIAMLDIDHFKDVNDRLGHQAGDQVLIQIARILNASVRRDDTLVRWGGEEFLLSMHLRDEDDPVMLVDTLRERMENTPVLLGDGKGPAKITVSVGVTRVSQSDTSLYAVVKRADQALLRAKKTGRNRVFSDRCVV